MRKENTQASVDQILQQLKPIDLPPLPEKPLVSMLIPNYNYGHLIEQAVGSVLTQTYQNFEIVICDDGSTDGSRPIIECLALQDARIRAIFKPNGGVASALNAAFLASKGDLIALLDADDIWLPDRLEEVVKAFRFPSLPGMVIHPLRVIELKSGKTIKNRAPRKPDKGWLAPRLIAGDYCVLPPASGLTMRREIAEKVFPLPEEFRTLADGILRERAALFGIVEVVDAVLGLYRQHDSNATGAVAQIERIISNIRTILASRASFIKETYGVDVDPLTWEQRPGGEMVGELLLAELVLKGKRVPLEKVKRHTQGKRRVVWIFLASMPIPWSQKALRWWWEDQGRLKKVVRALFPLSR